MEAVTEEESAQGLSDEHLERMLVEQYLDLLRLAYLILHDHPDAEDVTQLALERAWRYRAQVRSADSATYWLRRIVVREALRARSSTWRRLRFPLHLAEVEPPAAPGATRDADWIDILHAFDRLPVEQSAAVVLHHYFAYSIADVAEMVGAPQETVRSRLRLAMRRLREELRDA